MRVIRFCALIRICHGQIDPADTHHEQEQDTRSQGFHVGWQHLDCIPTYLVMQPTIDPNKRKR